MSETPSTGDLTDSDKKIRRNLIATVAACARSVLPVYERVNPHDYRVRATIDAVVRWTDEPEAPLLWELVAPGARALADAAARVEDDVNADCRLGHQRAYYAARSVFNVASAATSNPNTTTMFRLLQRAVADASAASHALANLVLQKDLGTLARFFTDCESVFAAVDGNPNACTYAWLDAELATVCMEPIKRVIWCAATLGIVRAITLHTHVSTALHMSRELMSELTKVYQSDREKNAAALTQATTADQQEALTQEDAFLEDQVVIHQDCTAALEDLITQIGEDE